ncbi:uncharacterized protein N7500_010086 [Penicillium coprophilum]|uniref:uncharacterized protein n=1 Tax=Penicillium coprophilum TaxID=36646 RepID=UPI0023A3F87C|nr:uncharacterized protein N7500_010086 [Penicillium coprophilum]KAJ5154647.1 hypothetical protein N7500_010086 [Penicillium coprophilum]
MKELGSQLTGFSHHHSLALFSMERVDDTNPVPAPNDRQLEELTRLRYRRELRIDRRTVILEVSIIVDWIGVMMQHTNGPQLHLDDILEPLEPRLNYLLQKMTDLRNEELADRRREQSIWASVA